MGLVFRLDTSQNIAMIVDSCPVRPDEIAEAYLLGTLPKERRAAFEEHFIGCPQCGDRLQFTEEFVLAVRRVAAGMGVARAANSAKWAPVTPTLSALGGRA
jgi:anti-sigma factor RsiW